MFRVLSYRRPGVWVRLRSLRLKHVSQSRSTSVTAMCSLTPRQRTGIALAIVVLPALTATAWPLLVFLRSLLPDDLPFELILLGTALSVTPLVAVVPVGTRQRTPVRLWRPVLAAWTVAVGAVAGISVLIRLVLGAPGLDPPAALSAHALDAIAAWAFAVVAGLGGAALPVIAYRCQRTAQNGERREATRLFTERFTAAGGQLGSGHAAVRLAGVHALAHLADDTPEDRDDLVQLVIDVLCAYLRIPYAPVPGPLPGAAGPDQRREHRERGLEFASFQQVRHTVIRIIGDHLRRPTRWRGKDYDFTGVVFDGGDLHGAVFTGGTVDFSESQFTGGTVDFSDARFTGGTVRFEEVSGSCPNGLAEAVERAESTMALPGHWQRTAAGGGEEKASEPSVDTF